MMAARLKRHIRGSTARALTRHTQCMYLSVRFTRTIVEAFADDFAVIHDHAADIRVRMW
jgi:hypothetical protein